MSGVDRIGNSSSAGAAGGGQRGSQWRWAGEARGPGQQSSLRGYLAATAAVAGVTLLGSLLRERLDAANIVMLFLLVVLFAAVRLGRGPGVLSAFLSVAAFDFFLVHPHFTFAVSDVQYVVTFVVMLVVALITAHLTAGLRYQLAEAERREQRTGALYEMARELSAALTEMQVDEIARRFVDQGFQADAAVLVPGPDGTLAPVGDRHETPAIDGRVVARVADRGEAEELVGEGAGGRYCWYLPLKVPARTRGVLLLAARQPAWQPSDEQRRMLETGAALVAIALERLHYVAVAQDALVQMASERLRNSLLAALSHDLRTPLTALVGLADSLAMDTRFAAMENGPGELARAIRDEALRTSALVDNLLDMARFQSGRVTLKREWLPLEEVVGTALQARSGAPAAQRVEVDLPASLPLLEIDAMLIERVLCNLLENAAKYTPPGSRIRIEARTMGSTGTIGSTGTMGAPAEAGEWVVVAVCDDGPGLPPGRERELFEKFARGRDESAIPGVGLGLSIVQAIVQAHGGRVWAENRPTGGACFSFSLPVGLPPEVPAELP